MENTNERLSIHYGFKISPYIVFEVNYYRCGNNKNKHFSTSASQFNRSKTDYNQCGQAQEDLLPKHSAAYSFYKKWDKKHLSDLCKSEYTELLEDLKKLEEKYIFVAQNNGISFSQLRELSKTKK